METTAGIAASELRHFGRFCLRDPRRLAAVPAFYAGKAIQRLVRAWPSPLRYPAALRECLVAEYGPGAPLRETPPPLAADGQEPDEQRILLARGSIQLSEIEPQWQLESADWEQIQSLHRWNWLLTSLTEHRTPGIRQWGLAKISDWWNAHGGGREHSAWTAYTAGERLTNSLLFCLRAPARPGEPRLPDWIPAALETHATWIAGHLEFYGSGLIGNHILNNARALYFYGRVFGARRFDRASFELLARYVPVLLSPAGFLREGSSHYHFLITRWLLEILWLAEVSGDEMPCAWLRPHVAAAVERCWFFLIHDAEADVWRMPPIGDVSPDFPPDWLVGVPWSEPALKCFAPEVRPAGPREVGWANLFPGSTGRTAPERPRGMSAFRDDGWYRLDDGAFTLFWHVEPQGVPLHPSHGHCDTGSFCLYLNGAPLLTDPGRYSYASQDSRDATAAAHTSVRVDGFEPFVYSRLYPGCYRKANVRVSWQTNPAPRLTISHDGFARLGGAMILSRSWSVRGEVIEIEDKLEGTGEHWIETFFQWAPGLELALEAGTVECRRQGVPLCVLETERERRPEVKPGWVFPAYGRRVPAATLLYRQKSRLPIVNRYVLRAKIQIDPRDTFSHHAHLLTGNPECAESLASSGLTTGL